MSAFREESISPEQVAQEREVAGPLASAIRELVDAGIRSTVGHDEMRAVTTEIEQLTARLRASQLPGAYGTHFDPETGQIRNHGNAVVGLRNAVAPPVTVVRDFEQQQASADFHLGAAYEGPPGLVHGGVTALILDQVFGEAASTGGAPGMTGTLTIRYQRGTPLGDLHCEARIDGTEGWKTFVTGSLADADGDTVTAQGIFVTPKWAREHIQLDREQGRDIRFE